jgi:glycerol-3-phosphate acyltransferase PlsY
MPAALATALPVALPEALGWLFASYLVGAIPASYLVSRAFAGIDLRERGSKNLGATNLYRVLGWKYAVPVGLFDVLKGVVPVLVFAPRVSDAKLFALACGVAAIVGHVFSVFVRFKGGKGVATAAGAIAALHPLAILGCALIWGVVLYTSGYVSLGSITAAALLPVLVAVTDPGTPTALIAVDAVIAGAIIWFHRANIGRLLHGTEHRFGRRAVSQPRL